MTELTEDHPRDIDGYSPAAMLYIAAPDAGPIECYRRDCEEPSIVAFTFMAEHEPGEVDEGFVYVCRTHMHGWMGYFLDHGEPMTEVET